MDTEIYLPEVSVSSTMASKCLSLISESPFIWVYNQTPPTKPNLFESIVLMSECRVPIPRSGKSTHSSMISNSVTHLRSYRVHTCTNHCGRNTHFRQIYFAVPNFNFIYIYIILKITRCPAYFLKKYAKTGNQRKLRK